MAAPLKIAVAGVGNNISALLQGIYLYRQLSAADRDAVLPGVTRPVIGGIGVADVQIVAAFDVHPNKVGKDLADGIFAEPNNYPRLDVAVPHQNLAIAPGLREDGGVEPSRVVEEITRSGAEVLLYSLPTGLQWAAEAYAEAALAARTAFVNCTPEVVARSARLREAFEEAGLPLVGDDLASHLGASVLHRALLRLFVERGITLESSYQVNFGGNEDFRNLRDHGSSKKQSKLNALAHADLPLDVVEVIPSAGYIPHLRDHKVAVLNIEGRGWGDTPVSLDVKLNVQDSSNAAGVIIDLVRIAGACHRVGIGGFPVAASNCLKSPAVRHDVTTSQDIDADAQRLERLVEQRSGR